MSPKTRNLGYFAIMAALLIGTGFIQSWNVAFGLVLLCLISAIMSLGVNIQWGYAGLFNVGIMGFTALGGLAAVLISAPPVYEAWSIGASGVGLAAILMLATIFLIVFVFRKMTHSWPRQCPR